MMSSVARLTSPCAHRFDLCRLPAGLTPVPAGRLCRARRSARKKIKPLAAVWCVCLLAIALACQVGPARAQAREFATTDRPALADPYPERVTHFPGGVTGLADVVYSVLPGYRPLIVDLYLPPRTQTPRPLILYIHGGGWIGGHTRHGGAISDFPALLASLASEGFVVASLEYRLAEEAPYPAQLQDARAAVRFLKANAARYGIDPNRVIVWGASAGGHIAALLAVSCGVTSSDPEPAPPGSECVQGAAIWYGVFDLKPVVGSAGAPARTLLGCTASACTGQAAAGASPITFVTASAPPFLLVHGEGDRTVPEEQSRAMERRLEAAGVRVEAQYLPQVDHSFVGRTSAETRAATLRAVNLTFDFFHSLNGDSRQ